MAHSVAYWYDYITNEKETLSTLTPLTPNIDNSQTLLSDITTTSIVSRWRLWVWAVAACCYSLEVLFDLFVIELTDIASTLQYGTIPWWIQTAKNFQYGDAIVFTNNQYTYAVIDPTKQIVKMGAGVESGGGLILKVAKLVGTTMSKLDPAAELPAFTAYIMTQKIRPAGVTVTVISIDPDDLQIYGDVKYDPFVLKSTGESIAVPGTYPVQDAINAFISNADTQNFNGILELADLEVYVESVVGVKEFYVTLAQARSGASPFVAFTESYASTAGYLTIYSGTPLSGTLNYI